MDGQSLQSMWESGSPFLAQMGEQSFNLAQQKAQQALQAAQGQEQRAQAMQPLEEAHKQALTRQGNANAASVEDNRAAQLPAADRMKQAMADYRKKMNDNEAAEEDTKMKRRLQYAEMAAKNKGVLPLEYMNSLPEEERVFYANPQATQRTQALAKAWYDSHPKTMESRAKQEAELEKARIAAGPGYARAEATKAAASARTGSASKMSDAQLSNYYEMKAADTDDPDLKAEYQALADRAELKALRKIREGVEVRKEGEFDLSAKGVPTVPRTGPTATPRAGASVTPKPKEVDVETFSPEQKKAAAAIREQFYNKKITEDQAIQQIEALVK